MVEFSNNLYISDSLSKKEGRIRRSLRMRRGLIKVYIISICDGTDQLEIYNSSILKQKLYRYMNIRIVGITDSMEDATNYVIKLVEDNLRLYGNADIKSTVLKGFM